LTLWTDCNEFSAERKPRQDMSGKRFSQAREGHFKDRHKENLRFLDKKTFVVCSMFTPGKDGLVRCADRLARSCEKYGLPCSIYRVPEIHRSLSPAGTGDLTFTKANFISFNLARFPGKNILCLDVDMFFMDNPDDIIKASESGYDFAVYNWLHDEHNETYLPVNGKLETGNRYSDFYVFSHSVNFLSDKQLLSSGGVQFYRNSPEAVHLLELWQTVISENPDYADDQCLDYAYKNFIPDSRKVKAFWLDKAYIRFPWWPHVKPVILHPELCSVKKRSQLEEIDGRKRFYPERCRRNTSDFFFPGDCIIDTKEHMLLKHADGRMVDRIPTSQEFWLYPEDSSLE
jgi:Nucleotide-diphospho-sugar transferase